MVAGEDVNFKQLWDTLVFIFNVGWVGAYRLLGRWRDGMEGHLYYTAVHSWTM